MLDWNVLVDVRQHSFSPAYLLFEEFGTVYQSDFEDILLLKVNSIPEFIAAFNQRLVEDPDVTELTNRVMPVTSIFSFQSQEEFETKAKKVVLERLPMLEGKKIHVRMHRKGFKDRIDRHEEETFLDQIILQELEKIGKPGIISGIDPDVIVSVETISDRAGLSFWTRQDWEKSPWLKLEGVYRKNSLV
jgi:tRNA(Ser,Leu) C12 N-acetylase TAN1